MTEYIKSYAFKNAINLRNLRFNNNIKLIGMNSFENSGLETIEIPNSVIEIGNNAFSNCLHLEKGVLGNGIKSIKNETFSSCIKISSIYIPESIISIEDYAFANCTNLSRVLIKGKIDFKNNSFVNCSKKFTIYYCSENKNFIQNKKSHVNFTKVKTFFDDDLHLQNLCIDVSNNYTIIKYKVFFSLLGVLILIIIITLVTFIYKIRKNKNIEKKEETTSTTQENGYFL